MSGNYRAFCAYGPHYRAPGCGWEATAESETEAERLAEDHSEGQTHAADYERHTRVTNSPKKADN